ncbi:HAMP domain-containing histidine kinase [Flavobacteriales bacterium]|nr:HAMP domain-containing histidine kinase [Flavobacteriales bacterium]
MKLSTKSGLSFISASAIFFFLGSILMYFSVRVILAEDLKDRLLDMQSSFMMDLSYANDITIMNGAKTFVFKAPRLEPTLFSDTVLIESGRYNLFRKITFSQVFNHKIYKIEILQSQSQTDLLVWRIVILNVGLAMLFFLIIFFVNHLTVKRTLKVFYNTIDKLENFDVGKSPSLSLEDADVEEIKKLNDVFNEMSKKIKSDFDEQKEYTENVSHELQTPLAIISSKAEELLQSERLNKLEMEHIGIIMKTINRLAKINQSLIFLTKIDNRFYTEEESFKLSDVIHEKINFFTAVIERQKINVSLDISDDVSLKMNKYLSDTLFLNLIKNSIIHNINGGFLEIKLLDNILTLKNSGQNITHNSVDIFKRFYRDQENKKSLGIGLSIVKRICDLYDFKIHYSFEDCHVFKIEI